MEVSGPSPPPPSRAASLLLAAGAAGAGDVSPGRQDQHAQTAVCQALGHYEEALRGAVREIHDDLQAFKSGVERQVAEVLRLAAPLSQSVAELQRDNRQLRAQLERLARQVGSLERAADAADGDQAPAPPPPARAGSSHVKLALAATGKSQNLDFERRSNSSVAANVENGHYLPGRKEIQKENLPGMAHPAQKAAPTAPPPSASLEAHAPAVSLRKPHLPVTAVTRVMETFSGETVGAPASPDSPPRPPASIDPGEADLKSSSSQAEKGSSAVKTWSSSSTRTSNASLNTELFSSVTKSVSSMSYESSISTSRPGLALKSPPSPPPANQPRPAEKRKELVRSQTLPRTSTAEARKALFEKMGQEIGKGRGGGRPKLKRSQSFGVASASSIKQILLDWCRSKTIGYKHVDLQNFSTSWSDGMAFCAIVHSFFPEAFDYQALQPSNPRENYETAFSTAEKMAGCDRLIEVEDMMEMRHKPDPMCVFTYIQSLYNHLRPFE